MRFAILTLSVMLCAQVHAGVAWNEDVSGDLSNSGLSPTVLDFVAGDNTVAGTMGGGGETTDRDYFSFVVPDGTALASIIVNPVTSVSGSASFFAIQAGPRITTTPNGQNVQDLLGFGHYGNEAVGNDLLPVLLLNPQPTLPAGAYSIWVQETGGTVAYSFDFHVTPVPEAPAGLLLCGGLATLALRRGSRHTRPR